MRKHHDNEAFRARSLLERGDGGYRPGDQYPTLSKGSFYDEVFAAAFGRTEKEHDEAMDYQARKFARDSRKYSLTSKKLRGDKKQAYKEDVMRRSGALEFSIDNKFILPREISTEEFINAYSAVAFINAKGIALNSHITISSELLGITPKNSKQGLSHLHDKILHPLRNWYKQRGVDFFWLYVNEYSAKSGFHTHLLTHIPPEHSEELTTYLFKRAKKINSLPQFNERSVQADIDDGMDLFKQWSLFQYICKGINRNHWIEDAHSGERVYLEELIWAHYENPGNFHHIKKMAYSQNVNKAARQQSNFTSLLEQGITDKNWLYSQGKPTRSLALEQNASHESHNVKNPPLGPSIFDSIFDTQPRKTEDFKPDWKINPFEINNLKKNPPKKSP